MADLIDKKKETAIKKMNADVSKLEKRLEVVYDSIVGIDIAVVDSVQNFINLYEVIQEISNVDWSDSKLNTSLDALNQNINAFVGNLGIVKATLMEINGLEYNVGISNLNDNTNGEPLNGLGWEKVGEIFLEKAIEVFFETLIKKIGDKSTRKEIVTWAKKIIESDALKGALLSLSYMIPSYDDILMAAVNLSGKIGSVMPMAANIAIPTAVGVAAGYSEWRINNESLDLNSNIRELGEEEGRIAAGTDLWDKAAIMQYDINKANASMGQAYADMFASIGEQVGILYEGWTDKMNLHQSNVQLTNEAITQANVGMLTLLGAGTRTLYEDGTEKMLLHQTNIQTANEGMTQAYVDMFSKIGEDVGYLYGDWGQKIELYQSDTQTANEAITKSYVDMFTELGVRIDSWWNEDVLPLFSEENWTFEGIGAGLSKSIEAGVGAIIQGLNTFTNWMENDFSITLNTNVAANGSITKPYGTTIKPYLLQTYEIGGFPEDGLFMANHGELVGKFSNGKTAVANNEQIVSGIKLGVREAVSEVLAPYLADIAQNTRETANKDFKTYIGDKEIARASERGRRAMGLQLITEF